MVRSMSENVLAPDLPEQDRDSLALLYATGNDAQECAKKLGVTDRTIRRWLQDIEVRRQIHEIRSVAVGAVSGKMQYWLKEAMVRLYDLTHNKDDALRLRAIDLLSDLTLKLRAFDTFEDRLREIEALLAKQGENGTLAG